MPWLAAWAGLAALLLAGCVSLRAPRLVGAHHQTLAESLAAIREVGQQLASGERGEALRARLAAACDPVKAVGATLTTQARPLGELGEAWDALRAAQHRLQLACGDLTVELGLPAAAAERAPRRLATARDHLVAACAALEAAGQAIDRPAPGCE